MNSKTSSKVNLSKFRSLEKFSLFPSIYQLNELKVEKNLQPIILLQKKYLDKINNPKVIIEFKLPKQNILVDVYLFCGGKKKDMYYSVSEGNYKFEMPLKDFKKGIELFYVSNNKKSPSIFLSDKKKL